jgi:hypothetical protein
VRSWTVTHGCVVAAAVAVPVTRPLEDIDKPGGIPPFVISQR